MTFLKNKKYSNHCYFVSIYSILSYSFHLNLINYNNLFIKQSIIILLLWMILNLILCFRFTINFDKFIIYNIVFNILYLQFFELEIIKNSMIIFIIILIIFSFKELEKDELFKMIQNLIDFNILLSIFSICLIMLGFEQSIYENRFLSILNIHRYALITQRLDMAAYTYFLMLISSILISKEILNFRSFSLIIFILITDSRAVIFLTIALTISYFYIFNVNIKKYVAIGLIVQSLIFVSILYYFNINAIILQKGERDILNGRIEIFNSAQIYIRDNFETYDYLFGSFHKGGFRNLKIVPWQDLTHSYICDLFVKYGAAYFFYFICIVTTLYFFLDKFHSKEVRFFKFGMFFFISYLFLEPDFVFYNISILSLLLYLDYRFILELKTGEIS